MNLSPIRRLNLVLTFLGLAVFSALFLYITLAPKDFDQRTRDFAIAKVQDGVDDRLGELAQSETADKVAELAGRVSKRLQSSVDSARASLDGGMDVFVADILAAACKLDCDRRDAAAEAVRTFYESSILRHTIAMDRVQSLVEGEYDEVMGELRTDLKVFSSSTAFAFAVAFLLSIFRGKAAAHLLPISLALTAATLLAAVWYLFGQDWVMTILFSNYLGSSYAVLLGGMSLLMADIAANKARVTSFVFNALGNVFGGVFDFTPC